MTEETIPPAILIVDNHPANLLVIQEVLKPLGHVLVTAASGMEALRHLLARDFALVLLDVEMPIMDGFETAKIIKQREKSRYTPIIFVTAEVNAEPAIYQAYTTGAVDYLAKPINPHVLRSKVSVFVELYQQRERIRLQGEQLQRIARVQAEREHTLLKTELEKDHLAQIAAVVERQRSFLADVLRSVTDGRLRLCDHRRDLPKRLAPTGETIPLGKPDSLYYLRHATINAAKACDLTDERSQDLVTATSEAAMNAIVHARGGSARVFSDIDGGIQVWISDRGAGIAIDKLPRATLERGYSTAGTLGHGFWLMLKTVDQVFLLTTKTGTTIVLEQNKNVPASAWH